MSARGGGGGGGCRLSMTLFTPACPRCLGNANEKRGHLVHQCFGMQRMHEVVWLVARQGVLSTLHFMEPSHTMGLCSVS